MNIKFPENPIEGATYTFNFKTWQYTAGAWSPVGTYQSITGATGPAIWGQTGTAIYYTSGNVGIGTSNPSSKLHVDGTSTFTDVSVISTNSSSTALRITQAGLGAALVVEDSTNPDATPFVVDASGNVGIGTSSPESKLHVDGDILLSGGINSTGSIPLVTSDLTAKGITAQALHRSPNSITAMFIYDTSKDSDGGAWTERCQHTSWWNETIYGKWLGAQDSERNARFHGATLGANLGDPYASVSGYIVSSGTAPTISAGWLAFNPGVGFAWASKDFTTVAGRTYRLTGTFRRSASNAIIFAGTGGGAGQHGSITLSAGGAFVFYFTATGTTSNVGVQSQSGTLIEFQLGVLVEVIGLTTASGDYFQLTSDGKFYRLWKNWVGLSEGVLASFTSVSNVTQANTSISGFENSLFYGDNSTTRIAYKFVSAPAILAGQSETYSFYIQMDDGLAPTTDDFDVIVRGGGGIDGIVITAVAPPLYRVSRTRTYASGTSAVGATYGPRKSTTNSARSFRVSGHQVEFGAVATSYEAKTTDNAITEVFRGNKRDFPRLAAIVGEASNLTIYDLTEPGRPMWMRFNSVPNSGYTGMLLHNTNCTGISAINGNLVTCGNASWQSFLTVLNFIRETGRFYGSGSGTGNVHGLWRSNFANRNTAGQYEQVSLASENIANNTCNAVALTVLPDAPVDPVSNLRVPTIAVATSGGASVIRHNGSVANHTTSGWNNGANSVAASGNTFIFHSNYNNSGGVLFWNNNTFTGQSRGAARLGDNNGSNGQESRYIPTSVPRRNQSVARTTGGANSSLWISLVREGNFAAHSVVSNMFNTGWMTGDIRRCFLSDVGAGSVTGPELVTNGTPSNTTGVTLTPGTTYAYDWELTATTARIAFDTGQINPAGRYRVVTTNEFNLGTEYIQFGSTVYGQDAGTIVLNSSYAGFYTVTAPWRYVTLSLVSTLPATWKTNVPSVRMAVEERSYKASYAAIAGTLTKTQLASGTSLVGYSGWSAANYLQEPYSTDLDLGTGEWTASAWVNVPDSANLGGNLLRNDTIGTQTGSTRITATGPTGISESVGQFGDGITQFFSYYSIPGLQAPVSGRRTTISLWVKIVSDTSGTSGSVDFYHYAGPPTQLFTFSAASQGVGNWFQISRTGLNSGTDTQFRISVPAGMIIQVTRLLLQYGSTVGTFVDGGASQVILRNSVADRAGASGTFYRLFIDSTGCLGAQAYDGTTTRTVTTTSAYNTGQWIKASMNYTTDGTLALIVNGREVATTRGTPLLSLSSRYNLLTYTEQFNNAIWEKSNTTVVTNAATAPNETTTAELLYPTTSGSNRRAIQYTTLSSGATYTGTIYVKAAGKSWVAFGPVRANSLADEVFFNVSTGVRGTVGASASASSITDVGNGWYRLSVTMSESATDAFFLDICDADGSTSVTASGTDGVLIWGAQLETGSTARTYQRVTTVAETEVAPLTIGNSYALDAPFPGSISLLKLGATVPTAEQEAFMYDQEKQLFRADAACVLPDSGAIVDMAYDDATDRWVVVSASNESYWTGLVRNSVTAVPAGSFTRVAAGSGVDLAARSTTNPGVDVTIPAYGLREELVKRAEAAARMSKELAIYDYVGGFTANITTGSTAITSVANLTYPTSYIGGRISGSGIPTNTTITSVSGTTIYLSAAATLSATGVSISFLDFRLPVGMEARTVFSAGVQQREGSTAAFTRLYDGFVETIRFAVAPGSTALITIQATRGTIQ